ncbi:MAG: ABC transporter ATP-binding protein [Candidatus Paceibacterota bacterium]
MENIGKVGIKNPNPLRYLLSKTWQYSLGNRRNVVRYWIMFIVAISVDIIVHPLVLAKVMDIIQKEGVVSGNIGLICQLLLVTLAVEIFFWIFHGPARVIERTNAFKAKANYKMHLLKGVLTLPLDWHSEHHSGDTIDKIEKGTVALYSCSADSFLIIQSVVQLVVSYAMLTYFCPSAGLIVIAMMAVTFWITTRFDRVLVEEYRKLNQAENKITAGVSDAISNITTVIILRVERLVFESLGKKITEPYGLFRKNSLKIEVKWFLTNMCCSVMTIIVLSAYFYTNLNAIGGILIGNVYLLFRYLEKMSELFFKFCSMYGDILQRKARVLNAEELTIDFRPSNLNNHILPSDWRKIEIKNLSFSYGNGSGSKSHLKDISLSCRRGEKIALVGLTGSGKTTCLKVMRDLYHPQNLDLEVDGQVIPQGFEGIARAITLIPQDPEIFATTILTNITLGADHDPALIERAMEMASFTEVVQRLPNGLESTIKEKGVNLSGGERQRLALARGLLACFESDKSLVLLDEPTSSVDVVTESNIYAQIFRIFQGKTIISSIHRLHLLSQFDMIYMFQDGVIVGRGTLSELLASCPEFNILWKRYQEHHESYS